MRAAHYEKWHIRAEHYEESNKLELVTASSYFPCLHLETCSVSEESLYCREGHSGMSWLIFSIASWEEKSSIVFGYSTIEFLIISITQ